MGSGTSRLLPIALIVESGMGVVRAEFLAKAVDREHVTHISANPILSGSHAVGGGKLDTLDTELLSC